jgi:hypothetical protein
MKNTVKQGLNDELGTYNFSNNVATTEQKTNKLQTVQKKKKK